MDADTRESKYKKHPTKWEYKAFPDAQGTLRVWDEWNIRLEMYLEVMLRNFYFIL